MPPFGQSAVAAEHGSSLEIARSIGLIARTRESLRRLAEHRTSLLGIALGFAVVPPGFPNGTGPS